MKNIHFTPGPAELYFTVEGHIRNALKAQIPSISHRSSKFQSIYSECTENLKELLAIPKDYYVFFTGSATEVWERIIQNNVEVQSHHYVNGAFSKRFYQTALDLGYRASVQSTSDGQRVVAKVDDVPQEADLLAFTLNETSTGVTQPLSEIYAIAEAFPDRLVAVDAVSVLPHSDIDYPKVDSVFFSVQKGFGLPAGLGVWIMSPRSVEKSRRLKAKGQSVGSYHSIPSLLDKGVKNQTPETPNVLNIYLLAKVCGDMLKKGIKRIRQETEYKASLLYHTIDTHPTLKPFVKDPQVRSKTVVVAETQIDARLIIEELAKSNMILGSGYGSYKANHIRIANFPTHSKEQVEMLVDKINIL